MALMQRRIHEQLVRPPKGLASLSPQPVSVAVLWAVLQELFKSQIFLYVLHARSLLVTRPKAIEAHVTITKKVRLCGYV
jgi:hypothetical protein